MLIPYQLSIINYLESHILVRYRILVFRPFSIFPFFFNLLQARNQLGLIKWLINNNNKFKLPPYVNVRKVFNLLYVCNMSFGGFFCLKLTRYSFTA